MSIFNIDSDICQAETLSSKFYTDEKYFHKSKGKIFERSWQLIGSTNGIEGINPFTILENFLDEPVLITKHNENFNCFSNVCTHRGKLLVEEKCNLNNIRCGYHGRRFDLNGSFLSMPEFEAVANFPSEKDNLPKIAFDLLGKFLFVSIDPYSSFSEFLSPVNERLKWLDWQKLKFSKALSRDYFVNAHWALYCENYLEGFHIPFVHQSLNEVVDYGTYETETFRFASLQTAFTKSGENGFDFDSKTAALYFFFFPNLMLNFYPWGLSINIVKPLEKDLTKVTYLILVSDESKLNEGAGANLNRVELEDQQIVESVQKGIRSRFYKKGRYSPKREQGIHHFHRLIAEFMQGS